MTNFWRTGNKADQFQDLGRLKKFCFIVLSEFNVGSAHHIREGKSNCEKLGKLYSNHQ